MQLAGLAESRRDQLATEAERLIRAALAAAGLAGARALAHGGPPTPEDLATVAKRFTSELWQLLGLLAVAFAEGAAGISAAQAQALVAATEGISAGQALDPSGFDASGFLAAVGITAAAEGDEETLAGEVAAAWLAQIRSLYGIPTTVAEAAEIAPAASEAAIEYGVGEVATRFLERARDQLLRVGDQAWATSRDALLEGLAAGDDLRGLAGRVQAASEAPAAKAAAIARNATMHAASAGELAEVQAMATALGLDGTKRWLSAHDDRVRPTHQVADGQTVGLAEHFMVGGWPMDRPHDPAGPPEETINCRCVLTFDLTPPPAMAAAALHQPRDAHGRWTKHGGGVPSEAGGGVAREVAMPTTKTSDAKALGWTDYSREGPHTLETNKAWVDWMVDDGHMAIQDYLETGKAHAWKSRPDPFEPNGRTHSGTPDDVKRAAGIIGGMMQPSKADAVGYRGIALPQQLKPGDRFRGKGFVAVAPDKGTARLFAYGRAGLSSGLPMSQVAKGTHPYVLQVILPKGTPGVKNKGFESVVKDGTYRVLHVADQFEPGDNLVTVIRE